MIALSPGGRVYLACGVTDMRKGAVGLAMLVQQSLAERSRRDDGIPKNFAPLAEAAI